MSLAAPVAAPGRPSTSGGAMPLAAHVREARRRATRAALALAVAMVAGFLLSDQILDVLRAPIEELAGERQASLNYATVTAAFDLRMRIAVVAGVILSSPVWLLELFGFVTPGLTPRERRYVVGFAAAAIPLFAAGCTMGLLLFPHMVEVMAGFSSDQDSTILDASYYVDFVLRIVLSLGLAFVLPVFVVVLNLLGVLPAHALRRGWRVIVVVITLFSALVTPAADVLAMFLVAAPMAGLFLSAVAIASVHDHRVALRTAALTPGSPSCSD